MKSRGPSPPALVLGATSLIGRFLSRRLTDDCVPFVEVSRQAPRLDRRWLQADLTDPDLAAKLPATELVYSLSPIWLLPPALAALKAAGMNRLIAFSSTSRFTKAQSPEPQERAVAARLADAEAQVEAFCAAHGVAWTILRPTMIYAEGQDANVSRLAALIRRLGWLPISGRGEGLRQPVHADDLAAGAIAAAHCPAAANRAYDLPGGETLSYRQMVGRIFEALGKRPLVLALPASVWSLAFGLARPLLPGATAAMGRRMAQDLTFDAAPAARDFGWAARGFQPKF
jgi:nucleoside-diphosphate-sugar epimerase